MPEPESAQWIVRYNTDSQLLEYLDEENEWAKMDEQPEVFYEPETNPDMAAFTWFEGLVYIPTDKSPTLFPPRLLTEAEIAPGTLEKTVPEPAQADFLRRQWRRVFGEPEAPPAQELLTGKPIIPEAAGKSITPTILEDKETGRRYWLNPKTGGVEEIKPTEGEQFTLPPETISQDGQQVGQPALLPGYKWAQSPAGRE